VDILTKGLSSSILHSAFMQAGCARHLCLSLRGSVEDGNFLYAMI
jgi:hypothetical protein